MVRVNRLALWMFIGFLFANSAAAGATGRQERSRGEYLLWTVGHGEPTTVLIRGGEIAGRRTGLFLAGGSRVWQWRELERETLEADCGCLERARAEGGGAQATCNRRGSAREAVLVDVETERQSPLFSIPQSGDRDLPHELARTPRPLISVGRYLFAKERTYTYACGAAHGYGSAELSVFDLVSGERVEILSGAERRRAQRREGARAFEKHERLGGSRAASLRDLRLTQVVPEYAPDARLAVSYQFTKEDCYACSDNHWASYTRSVQVVGRRLPRKLVRFARLPRAIRAKVAGLEPTVAAWGWTPVASEARAVVERIFGVRVSSRPR
jgi:hypothetical protein